MTNNDYICTFISYDLARKAAGMGVKGYKRRGRLKETCVDCVTDDTVKKFLFVIAPYTPL